MRVIERRRWMPDYDGEYVNDEAMEKEVERLAMAPMLASSPGENRPGAFIQKHGHKFRLNEMQSKHFQTGRYATK